MYKREIISNGVRINVFEGSNRTGEPILFLHPQGSSSKVWKPIYDYFNKDYYVILMDLRGHGASEKATFGYGIQTQCKDILAVLNSLKIDKVHLVGNSLGGDISTAFASFYPGNVRSLINIDSGMIDYIGANGERNLSKEIVLEEFRTREIRGFASEEDMYQYVQGNFPSSLWDSYFEEWFKYVSIYKLEDGRISYQIPIHINTQIMEMVCDLKYTELYKTITCPILFLPAEQEDHLTIKLENIDVASKYTYTKTLIIPNSKHLMILDQSNEICLEINLFLNEVKESQLIH